MTPNEFVERIAEVVFSSTVKGCLTSLHSPPGRRPSPQLLELSQWFNKQSDADKNMVRDVIKLASRQSIFGMFAVLDGVRQVEDSENRGTLELRYLKNDFTILLNDPSAEQLHDIFNKIVPPE